MSDLMYLPPEQNHKVIISLMISCLINATPETIFRYHFSDAIIAAVSFKKLWLFLARHNPVYFAERARQSESFYILDTAYARVAELMEQHHNLVAATYSVTNYFGYLDHVKRAVCAAKYFRDSIDAQAKLRTFTRYDLKNFMKSSNIPVPQSMTNEEWDNKVSQLVHVLMTPGCTLKIRTKKTRVPVDPRARPSPRRVPMSALLPVIRNSASQRMPYDDYTTVGFYQ